MITTAHIYSAEFHTEQSEIVTKLICADNIFFASEVIYAIMREDEKLGKCVSIHEAEEVYSLTPSTIATCP